MSLEKLEIPLKQQLEAIDSKGVSKRHEKIITGIRGAKGGFGPRVTLAGECDKLFLQMNSNSYLGLSTDKDVIQAEEEASRQFGTGPGAVRFISGTFEPHVTLEKKLATFCGRESAMIFSAAYAAVMGILPQLITEETVVISDALNHNCIINAIRLAHPAEKAVYRHLDMEDLEAAIKRYIGQCSRMIVITDGIFSMRGDHAPLNEIVGVCEKYEERFEEGIITVVDDSHGVGAFGKTGRGTEEVTGTKVDIHIGTLGKALGVNGGYVASSETVIDYLRETAPFYIFSNPITPSEAAAAIKSLDILDSHRGQKLLDKLRRLTRRLEEGLKDLGYETIPGEHPIVPLMIRDTEKTSRLVKHLFEHGILATGLNFPVVPKGDEEIRFQVSANHTDKDIDYLLEVLKHF
ncbi:aminotransferase class I/II-fold pyridoxal phosphate-dependent enzyme [Sulfurovum sp. TSL1]|uniref:aminotransferase class I/II-fold pyridoxal phosphate-dependent enzyme n=1 Tax=Sulfurovum sp. TSL1 TaxID=2826994 RepID=UPI001CC61A59|nr:aminotransferase class I/II-fold pyridoxal phosphate-dependent enzyme [Sulfurovum sp. TSL1]GIT97905.1 8-amino-7-oxononanoate synthase [Sulfurovum sp. TSL1]